MQLFPRHSLDCLGIILKRVDLIRESCVLLRQPRDLLMQVLVLGFLLPVNHHSIGAKHHMHKKPYAENRDYAGRNAPPNAIEQRERRPQPKHRPLGPGFCLRSVLHQRTQTVFRIGQPAYFAEMLYSKIHCLAPALNFVSSCGLAASEYTLTTGSVPDKR